MSAIKKFFEKKKLNRKFKKAGEGHVLSSAKSPPAATPARSPSVAGSVARPPSKEQSRAAAAALARLNTQSGEWEKCD